MYQDSQRAIQSLLFQTGFCIPSQWTIDPNVEVNGGKRQRADPFLPLEVWRQGAAFKCLSYFGTSLKASQFRLGERKPALAPLLQMATSLPRRCVEKEAFTSMAQRRVLASA